MSGAPSMSQYESPVPVIYIRAGKASDPMSKFLYRLFSPLRWWSRSTVRETIRDICMLPFRVKSLLGVMEELRVGIPMRCHTRSGHEMNPHLRHKVSLACSEGMERLRKKSPWSGVLESRLYFQAFVEGVESVAHSWDNEKDDA
jgi:hypothetical protein